jgi:serine/threonine-protein kinase
MQEFERTTSERAGGIIAFSLAAGTGLIACLLARRNVRLGRWDRRGALVLSAWVFALNLLGWLFRASHVPDLDEARLLFYAISTSLFAAALMWISYVALEPFVRRRWPQTMVTWSRVLAGKIRDPLVGRDLLTGVLFGLGITLLIQLRLYIGLVQGDLPVLSRVDVLGGARYVAAAILDLVPTSATAALFMFLLIFLLRAVLRREWLAGAAFVILFAGFRILISDNKPLDAVLLPAVYGIIVVVLLRFGLLTLVSGIFVADLLLPAPLTTTLSAWYAPYGVALLVVVAALAAFAFHSALAGRALVKDEML